jgi:hypothetical protein
MNDYSIAEQVFLCNSSDPSHAEALVRYARAYNLLEIDWLEDVLHPEVTYESQSVFDVLEGRERVLHYLSGKLQTLKKHGDSCLCRAELAEASRGEYCVRLYQKSGEMDRSFHRNPVGLMEIKVDADGLITTFFLCTVVPSPSSARGSGVFPGLDEEEVWPAGPKPRLVGPRYESLTLCLIQLDGNIELDRAMEANVREALRLLPGAVLERIVEDSPKGTQEQSELLAEWMVNSFPVLVVLWNHELLLKFTGVHSSKRILDGISEAIER